MAHLIYQSNNQSHYTKGDKDIYALFKESIFLLKKATDQIMKESRNPIICYIISAKGIRCREKEINMGSNRQKWHYKSSKDLIGLKFGRVDQNREEYLQYKDNSVIKGAEIFNIMWSEGHCLETNER